MTDDNVGRVDEVKVVGVTSGINSNVCNTSSAGLDWIYPLLDRDWLLGSGLFRPVLWDSIVMSSSSIYTSSSLRGLSLAHVAWRPWIIFTVQHLKELNCPIVFFLSNQHLLDPESLVLLGCKRFFSGFPLLFLTNFRWRTINWEFNLRLHLKIKFKLTKSLTLNILRWYSYEVVDGEMIS